MFYDPLLVGVTAFLVLVFLLAITVPIGVAMMLCGVGGLAMIIGLVPSLSLFGTTVMQSVVTYDLSIIPLFILMGALASRSGLSQELYDAFTHGWAVFVGDWRLRPLAHVVRLRPFVDRLLQLRPLCPRLPCQK